MSFAEKMLKLRKEKGMSQETLAEQLGTSRQAVSKWENGQGYPETEKLLMIGNIFEVSMDYLLKDAVQPHVEQEAGYYVSREMAEGYMVYARKSGRSMAFGLFFLGLAFVPYYLFEQEVTFYLLPTIVLATVGLTFLASLMFFEEQAYRVFKQEPLLLDQTYRQELVGRHAHLKKKYGLFILLGAILSISGFLPIALIRKKVLEIEQTLTYIPVFIVLIALGLLLVVQLLAVLEAYQLLAYNERFTKRFTFKLRRKLLKKFDEF